MTRRLVLLPSVGSGGPVELELLPSTARLECVLQEEQGLPYSISLPGGTQLHFRPHAASAWLPNPLASRLAGAPVCGDAVLALPAAPEADLQQRLRHLAARQLCGVEWRLSGAWGGASGGYAGGDASGGGGSMRSLQRPQLCRRLQQHEALRRLMRGRQCRDTPLLPDPGAAPPTPPAALGTAAPVAAPPAAEGAAGGAAPLAACTEAGPAAAVMAVAEEVEASRDPECGLPARRRASLEQRAAAPWADLQPELLAAVLAQAGYGASFARALSQVCSGWRQGIAAERAALQRLHFVRLEEVMELGGSGDSGSTTSNGSSRGSSGCSAAVARTAGAQPHCRASLPWLARQAMAAGNVAATVLAARWLERGPAAQQPSCPRAAAAAALASATWYGGGCQAAAAAVLAAASEAGGASEAARAWRAAAKLGHPEAQFKLGWAHYKGLWGLACDGEEAHLWLCRAARQLAEAVGLEGGGHGGSGGSGRSGDHSGGDGGGTRPPKALPVLMEWDACLAVLAQAAHILGCLCLDGEGVKADVGAALRWLRLAQRAGCTEAGRQIGCLLNTGMYG